MRELFLNLGLAFIPVTITLTALWLSARARALRSEETLRQIALRNAGPTAPTSRRGEVDSALDAVAVEVERIGEGQRFLTKLLAERQASGSSKSPGSNTPH